VRGNGGRHPYWETLRAEPGGRAPVLWTLNNMNRKALEMEMSPNGPRWGSYRGSLLPRTLRDKCRSAL